MRSDAISAPRQMRVAVNETNGDSERFITVYLVEPNLEKGNVEMPLPGGASAKVGLRYELLWTVNCMLRVMQDETTSIWLEPPGEDGQGIEFSLETGSGPEHHQVKRQLTGSGYWSLASLAREGVLRHFYQKLNDRSATCCFVSSHAAHPLKELTNRAQESENFASFKVYFLDSEEWSGHFDALQSRWGASDEEDAYWRLKRTFLHTIDEEDLYGLVESKITSGVKGNPNNVLDVLSQFALEQTHQRLTSVEIWAHLQSRGFSRLAFRQDIATALNELNDSYLAGTQPVGIAGEIIRRTEVNQIFRLFDDKESNNLVLLTGKAGVGKSSAISQVLEEVKNRDEPALCIRLDRLEASSTPRELGQALGLAGSPANVLANVAAERNCLLIIDQLDAVSLASGRNSDFFDCINAMLREAKDLPNLRVLAACRKFDLDNDPRIRQLISAGGIAEEVSLPEFDADTVKGLVVNLGIEPDSLSAKQIELLSLPVHLRLLAEVSPSRTDTVLRFQSAKELYDAYWDEKKRVLRRRVAASQMQEVADLMADSMSDRQTLSVPLPMLDDHHEVADLMASENILVKDRSRASFFHESFFDYIFARRKILNSFDAVQFAIDQGQSLFVRSQMRQILLQQREVYPEDALCNMSSILNHPDIRTHLKDIVLALLGSLDDPTSDEWTVIQPLLKSELSDQVWRAINGSNTWFDLLDSIGQVRQFLTSEDEQLLNNVMRFLLSVQNQRSDRVAELLSPFIGFSASWNQRLRFLIVYSEMGVSRPFFDFSLKAIRAGIFDDLLSPDGDDFGTWYRAKQLAESKPEMALELVAAFCERLVEYMRRSEHPRELLHTRLDLGGEVMQGVSTSVPEMFVESLLPFLYDVLDISANKKLSPPWPDPVWGHGFIEQTTGLDNGFLLAMEAALRWIASNYADRFRIYANEFKSSRYRTVHYLLMRSYCVAGNSYAEEAVEYLLEDFAGRFGSGHVSTSSDHAVLELIEAVTPYCSVRNLERLQGIVLDFWPDYEKGFHSRRRRGASQLQLLLRIENSRLSDKARRRLQELERKFAADLKPAEFADAEGGRVRSPIPHDSALKMNDDNWLGAMRRYSSETDPRTIGDWRKGGVLQLAEELKTQVKENPSRFAHLVHRMPDDANENYFQAILSGIAESEVGLEMELSVSACLRCDRIPKRPLGLWITQPLGRFPDSVLPNEALELIAWYATKHPNPEPGWTAFGQTFHQGRVVSEYEPLDHGINSVRGKAVLTVAKLVFQNDIYLSFFRPHLQTMVNDPSDFVRACVAEILLSILRYDRDFAVELFFKLSDSEERLLATHHFELFLHYAIKTHFTELEPVLTRMVESSHEETSVAGARRVCLASLLDEETMPLARHCASGSVAMRKGAAEIYAMNLRADTSRAECEEILCRLFRDGDHEVRERASRCFIEFKGSELGDYSRLVEAYIKSPAFEPGHNPLIRALSETTANMPDETLMACERYFELAGERAGDISTRVASDSDTVISLIIRVYSKATDEETKNRCLDLIDRAKLLGAYGVANIETTFDR